MRESAQLAGGQVGYHRLFCAWRLDKVNEKDRNTRAYYILTTVGGERYTIDRDGAVIDRSDGPRGWDYSGKWRILGVTTRHNARADRIIPLANLAEGEPFGQGWIHDLDHGTHRMWAHPSSSRLRCVERVR